MKGFIPIWVVILLVVGLAGGVYYLGQVSTKTTNTVFQSSVNPSPTSDPTANWKTYTNQNLDISFKYPPLMKDPGVNLLSTRTQILTEEFTIESGIFYDQSKQRNLTFDEYIKKNISSDSNISDYNLAGVMGKKIINKMQAIIAVQPSKSQPDDILTIYYDLRDHPGVKNELIDSILRTFKFTDQNSSLDTSNWKTYTDSNTNFNLKYPSTWSISTPSLKAKDSSQSFDNWVLDQNQSIAKYSTVYSRKNSSVDNHQVMVEETTSFPVGRVMKVFVLKDNSNVLYFTTSPIGNNDPAQPFSKEDLSTFNQILTTFKFIP